MSGHQADPPATGPVSGQPTGRGGRPSDELPELTDEQGVLLLAICRNALREALGLEPFADRNEEWLRRPAATFVTLSQAARGGARAVAEPRLRGCIGTVRPLRPLIEDLRANTQAAALEDPRFPPLTAAELARDPVTISVSLLSPLAALRFATERDVLEALRPGEQGVVFAWGRTSSTYLPQVWRHFDRSEDFLGSLKAKAGLPADFWAPDVAVWTFTVRSWSEG